MKKKPITTEQEKAAATFNGIAKIFGAWAIFSFAVIAVTFLLIFAIIVGYYIFK